MTHRQPSILSRVITASADRLATALHVPPQSHMAFRATVESILHAQWASMFGGESVRVYASRESQQARVARRARILSALAAGEAPAAIARRESVSRSWVLRLQKASVTAPGLDTSRPAP